jgi:hypothetical protein
MPLYALTTRPLQGRVSTGATNPEYQFGCIDADQSFNYYCSAAPRCRIPIDLLQLLSMCSLF